MSTLRVELFIKFHFRLLMSTVTHPFDHYSLDHEGLLRFVQHRVGDPRILCLIRRWLKAGVLEDGIVEPSDEGVPQGGSMSVVLSNLYLHYVLDLWFERVVRPRLQGEASLIRYIDDFVVCFQYQVDAQRFEQVLVQRLAKCALVLEPTKTRLVAFGRCAERDAKRYGKRRETFTLLDVHFVNPLPVSLRSA